jgi:hypothetical protein
MTSQSTIFLFGGAALVCGAVVALSMGGGTKRAYAVVADSAYETAADSRPEISRPARGDAGRLLAACDAAASDPYDPLRHAQGVSDEALIPVRAVEACRKAVEADPAHARANYQLGRALWLGSRNAEAIAYLAAAGNYPAAHQLLGDAYLRGEGLPPGEVQDMTQALEYYRSAEAGGYRRAANEAQAVQEYIKKNTFNAAVFQNPRYVTMLYSGDFSDLSQRDHHHFARYMMGLIRWLDSDQAMDHSPYCAPGLTYWGNFKSSIAGMVGEFSHVVGALERAFRSRNSDELLAAGVGFVMDSFQANASEDEGKRDAQSLINHYGCDSKVGERLLVNLKNVEPVLGGMAGGLGSSLQRMAYGGN